MKGSTSMRLKQSDKCFWLDLWHSFGTSALVLECALSSQDWIVVGAAHSALSHVAMKCGAACLESGEPCSDHAARIGSVLDLTITSRPASAVIVKGRKSEFI